VFVTSLSKAVTAVLRDHPERARMTRQFVTRAPSSLRDINPMIDALDLGINGLTGHEDHFSTRQDLHARLLNKARSLRASLGALSDTRKRELQETRAAAVERDLHRAAAIALITTLDDAAQAVYFDTPEPYDTLRTLYTIHCPEEPADSAPSDDLDLPTPDADPAT
jgi:hypothetical protein